MWMNMLEMSEVCGMLKRHVFVSVELHVDYFNVLFIYYFTYSVIAPIGDVWSLLNALKSCVGSCQITCELFWCAFYFENSVIEPIGDVRGLSDALTSCVGKYKIACGWFWCNIYFQFSVNECVGDVRSLLDAVTSCVGKYKITCRLFKCIFYFISSSTWMNLLEMSEVCWML